MIRLSIAFRLVARDMPIDGAVGSRRNRREGGGDSGGGGGVTFSTLEVETEVWKSQCF